MKKIILLLLSIGLLIACRKSEANQLMIEQEIEEVEQTELTLLWSAISHPDTASCSSITPIVYKDNVIYSRKVCEEGEVFEMRNTRTGDLVWQWDHFVIPDEAAYHGGVRLYEDKLVICLLHEIYVLDVETGQTIWQTVLEHPIRGDYRINVFDGYIYHVHRPPGNRVPYLHIVRSPIHTPAWDTIYTLRIEEGANPFFDSPAFYKTDFGETYMVFNEKYYDFPNSQSKTNLSCFNLTGDSLVWQVKNFNDFAHVSEPLVVEDRVYVAGHRSIYCFSVFDGELLWYYDFPNSRETFAAAPFLVEGNRLIVKPDNSHIYAFDKRNGQILWMNDEVGESCDDLVYYEGIIYFTCIGSKYLHGVEIENGKELWRQLPPNYNQGYYFGTSGLAIHTGLGHLYATTWKEILCYDLSK